jgi:rubrerythrin
MTKAQYTLDNILEKAIAKEIEAQELYSMMSGRVIEAFIRDELLGLVSYEKEHQAILEKYRKGGEKEDDLNLSQPVDWKIAECLDQPAVTPHMQLKDVFLMAANREKASYDLYRSLAELHSPGAVRTLFEQLAVAEAQHKSRVELLYTEVAFPQTDGG